MKIHEAWLEEIAKTAREETIYNDPQWEKLAARQLSQDEEQALKELAAQRPDAAAAYEAFRPFDERELDEIETHIVAKPANVVPLWRKRRGFVMAGSLSLVAAAAAVFLMIGVNVPPLPDYSISIADGDQVLRTVPTAPVEDVPQFKPGASVQIILRPRTAVTGSVDLRGTLVQQGQAQPWTPPVEITPEGTLRIKGTREQVFPDVPNGEWQAILAVGRPGMLPSDPAIARSGPDVQILRARVLLVPETKPELP